MKRIVNIAGNAVKTVLLAGIAGLASTAQAQDLYQIEQSIVHEKTITNLDINRGWDVHLIQAPAGSTTRVVLTTTCADYYEEGAEPEVLEVDKKWYTVASNPGMPRNTKVEIYTAQPIKNIILQKGARLTIQRFDFDSTKLDINIDSGAVLVVNSLTNSGTTTISATDATADLRHMHTKWLHIYASGASTVNEGEVQWHRQWITRGKRATTSITETDSARHVYVKQRNRHDRESKWNSLFLNLGLDLAKPAWLEGNRYNSPYNTNHSLGLNICFLSNDINIAHRLNWNLGLNVGARWMQLDNVVKAENGSLVLDPSHGATPPRQDLYSWNIGIPLTLMFGLDKTSSYSLYASLTPTYTFYQRLATSTLGEDNRRHREHEKVDVFRPFNVRAAIGLGSTLRGLGRLELYIDLLPTFKASAEAPQTRMMGLNYTF